MGPYLATNGDFRRILNVTLTCGVVHVLCLLNIACIQSPLPVTRADLADAYVALETEFAARLARNDPPSPEKLRDINARFDRASVAFFTAQFANAVRDLHALLADIRGVSPARDQAVLASLKLVIDPPVQTAADTAIPRVTIAAQYATPQAAGQVVEAALRLRDARGDLAASTPVRLQVSPFGIATADVEPADWAKLPPGSYWAEISADQPPDALVTPKARWYRVERSLDTVRQGFAQRLAAATGNPAAVGLCGARNALLSDAPSELNSAEFRIDLLAHLREVEAEITALERGENPYANRPGMIWRRAAGAAGEIPYWLVAPDAATDPLAGGLPLLIAFHGAGGDERMFIEGYGAGRLVELAKARQLLLVCPQTTPFLGDPAAFDQLREDIERDYRIDPTRVFLIGHSLGAIAAGRISTLRADQVAGVCTISGAWDYADAATAPPTLVIIADRDGISPPETGKDRARRAADRGLPVELRVMPDAGHTLVVGPALDDAVRWLLARPAGAK